MGQPLDGNGREGDKSGWVPHASIVSGSGWVWVGVSVSGGGSGTGATWSGLGRQGAPGEAQVRVEPVAVLEPLVRHHGEVDGRHVGPRAFALLQVADCGPLGEGGGGEGEAWGG